MLNIYWLSCFIVELNKMENPGFWDVALAFLFGPIKVTVEIIEKVLNND
jgi:hypothetical protein